jgi:hypothetical protein
MQCGEFIDGGPEIDDCEIAPVWSQSSWSNRTDNLFENLVETGVKVIDALVAYWPRTTRINLSETVKLEKRQLQLNYNA